MKKLILWLMLGVLLTICVGLLDLATGREISFSLFYLAPIVLVSWYCGRSVGVAISLFSAVTWFYGELLSHQTYSNEIIRYWNTGIRLGFFLIISFLVARLKIALQAEQELAQIDALTGVANSRHLHIIVENELSRSLRFDKPITVVYIDLDNFKFVNDHYGHDIGDQVIRLAARTMKQSIRNMDSIGRLGGDEFAVLLPETNQENASKAVTRLQQNLLAVMQDNHWPVTFSIGVFTCDHHDCDANQLFKEADNLMYLAKTQGKNAIRYGSHIDEIKSSTTDRGRENMPPFKIRSGTPDDLPFLREMLFEAAYWRLEQERPELEIGLARPDLVYLLADWGRKGDIAVLIIKDDGEPIGAAWYRFWGPEKHSYGYISPHIPELAIAIRSEFRGKGLGHQLLDAILEAAASQGVKEISLSVEVENPALNLYRQHGFEPIQQNKGDWIMVANTQKTR